MSKVQEAMLHDLRPTQLTVGTLVVEDKRKHLAKMTGAALEASLTTGFFLVENDDSRQPHQVGRRRVLLLDEQRAG